MQVLNLSLYHTKTAKTVVKNAPLPYNEMSGGHFLVLKSVRPDILLEGGIFQSDTGSSSAKGALQSGFQFKHGEGCGIGALGQSQQLA